MSTSFDSEPSGGRRLGRRLLLGAWLLLLLLAGAVTGYLALLPAPEPVPTAEVRQTFPPVAEPEERLVDAPPATPAAPGSGEDGGQQEQATARSAETEPQPSESGAEDTAPPPIPGSETTASGIPPPPPPAEESDTQTDSANAPQQLLPSETETETNDGDAATGQQTARAPATEPPPETAPSQSGPPPAWQRYAYQLTPPDDGLPKIAVVMRGLGLSTAASEAAVTRLPGPVSLAFSPYARERARAWAARARRQGHEVLLDLPMEPADFPARDPGPRAMMLALNPAQNLERLDWILAQAEQEVGVVASMGSAFLAEPQAMEPIFQELKARGLMYLDNGVLPDGPAIAQARSLGLPYAVNDRTLDSGQVSRPAIEARLVEAERIAQQDGLAVVLAHPFPITIDVLEDWSRQLEERGFVLVPATYAAERRSQTAAADLQ